MNMLWQKANSTLRNKPENFEFLIQNKANKIGKGIKKVGERLSNKAVFTAGDSDFA